jgi:hypothetical protein
MADVAQKSVIGVHPLVVQPHRVVVVAMVEVQLPPLCFVQL